MCVSACCRLVPLPLSCPQPNEPVWLQLMQECLHDRSLQPKMILGLGQQLSEQQQRLAQQEQQLLEQQQRFVQQEQQLSEQHRQQCVQAAEIADLRKCLMQLLAKQP